MTIHWVGFSGSINTYINEVTDNPHKVNCILCKQWMQDKGIEGSGVINKEIHNENA